MKTTTSTTIISVSRISGGTPKTNPITDSRVTPPSDTPSGVTVSILGVLNTNPCEVVIQINMYDTEDVASCSLSENQANVNMENDRSNGVAYIGVTLKENATNTPWEFDLDLEYAKANKKFKYTVTRM